MKRQRTFLAALILLCLSPAAGRSEDVVEVWRSVDIAGPRALAVNPNDGSCWVAGDAEIVHLAANGAVLWRGAGSAEWVSVNTSDNSCWLSGGRHVAEDGSDLSPPVGFGGSFSGSVNSTDGSVWSCGTFFDSVGNPFSVVWHRAADGTELWSRGDFDYALSVSVNPNGGSCWIAEQGHVEAGTGFVGSAIIHLAANGAQLWRGEDFYGPWAVSVNPTDGSCWVAATNDSAVVHLNENGSTRSRTYLFMAKSITANAADGSCWVSTDYGAEVAHVSNSGSVLWRGSIQDTEFSAQRNNISVDPTDGSCWVATGTHVVHLMIVPGGPHDLSVTAVCDPDIVGSGGVTSCAASFSDSQGHAAASWSWDDDGAGGTFTPSPNVRNPIYTAPANLTDSPLPITLTASAECDAPSPLSESGTCQVTVWPYGSFPDVPSEHWAHDEIGACFDAGIVGGYPDGLYYPELAVTRDQMAVYVARALAAPTGEAALADYVPAQPQDFTDVPDDFWAYRHVEYCVENGVVAGYPDGYYHPEYEVTRDQMAVYVARTLVAPSGEAGLEDYVPADPRNFPDVPDTGYGDDGTEPYWAYTHIEYCVEHGVVQGYLDGLYHPDEVVTRAQMAVYVARAFELTP